MQICPLSDLKIHFIGALDIRKMKKWRVETMRKPRIKENLKKKLEKLERYTGQDMKTINTELEKVLKSIGRSPEQPITALTDRELTEKNIENYNYLYELSFGKRDKINSSLHNYLLEYKLDKYGEEILKEMGFKVAGRNENGDFLLERPEKTIGE